MILLLLGLTAPAWGMAARLLGISDRDDLGPVPRYSIRRCWTCCGSRTYRGWPCPECRPEFLIATVWRTL